MNAATGTSPDLNDAEYNNATANATATFTATYADIDIITITNTTAKAAEYAVISTALATAALTPNVATCSFIATLTINYTSELI